MKEADLVIVTNDWGPLAYMELSIALMLDKKIVILNKHEMLRSALFPSFEDLQIEVIENQTFEEYLEKII